ncbi:hypothetical protein ACFV98_22490 [Streptomyces violascens]|uniref:hypothetical protein n=1 Tax=Streptomyces violascens TaxID=67381 RepID=UPI00364C53AB
MATTTSGTQHDPTFNQESHGSAHRCLTDPEDGVDLRLLHVDGPSGLLVPDHHRENIDGSRRELKLVQHAQKARGVEQH